MAYVGSFSRDVLLSAQPLLVIPIKSTLVLILARNVYLPISVKLVVLKFPIIPTHQGS